MGRRGGGGRLSRNQRSQKSFSRLLPRPARLNFFSAQEFSYYSEFPAAAKPPSANATAYLTHTRAPAASKLPSAAVRVAKLSYREGNFFSSAYTS